MPKFNPKPIISLCPTNVDIYNYLDINKTEFTVRKRPINSVSLKNASKRVDESYDNYNYREDGELYEIEPLNGRLLYDKYPNLSSNDKLLHSLIETTNINGGLDDGLSSSCLTPRRIESTTGLLSPIQHIGNPSLSPVTSFTVDRTQMLKNFHIAHSADHHRIE